jgi:hypothetical protein
MLFGLSSASSANFDEYRLGNYSTTVIMLCGNPVGYFFGVVKPMSDIPGATDKDILGLINTINIVGVDVEFDIDQFKGVDCIK